VTLRRGKVNLKEANPFGQLSCLFKGRRMRNGPMGIAMGFRGKKRARVRSLPPKESGKKGGILPRGGNAANVLSTDATQRKGALRLCRVGQACVAWSEGDEVSPLPQTFGLHDDHADEINCRMGFQPFQITFY